MGRRTSKTRPIQRAAFCNLVILICIGFPLLSWVPHAGLAGRCGG